MRRGVAYLILALVGVGVTACGKSPFEQREAWRLQAEEACMSQKFVQPSAYMSRRAAIAGPGACGMEYPFTVAALGDGTVGLSRQATLACPIIPRIDGWLAEVVQPAASAYLGAAVVEVKSGSYSCRPRNHRVGAKLSEHAFGNALDVMGFALEDGREVSVVKGWRGSAEEQDFLREVFVGACERFTTVLGPGSDALHYDHFHLDLARHDPRGVRRVCKPVLKFTPRLGNGGEWQGGGSLSPPPAIDMEEDSGDADLVSSRGAPARTARPISPVPRPEMLSERQPPAPPQRAAALSAAPAAWDLPGPGPRSAPASRSMPPAVPPPQRLDAHGLY